MNSKNSLKNLNSTWTLFLDRDGVINRRLMGDYVKNIDEFEFLEGSLEAIVELSNHFGRTLVVTNQQGIAKGLMSESDLQKVHDFMLAQVEQEGGKIDRVYFCPELAEMNANCRKPNTGMAEQALKDFPEIDFKKAIMVGDTNTDLQFGKRMGMYTVYIHSEEHELADVVHPSLAAFASSLNFNE